MGKERHVCPHCAVTFTRAGSGRNHIRRFHGGIGDPLPQTMYLAKVLRGELSVPPPRTRHRPTFSNSQPDAIQKAYDKIEEGLFERVGWDLGGTPEGQDFGRAVIKAKVFSQILSIPSYPRERTSSSSVMFMPPQDAFGCRIFFCPNCRSEGLLYQYQATKDRKTHIETVLPGCNDQIDLRLTLDAAEATEEEAESVFDLVKGGIRVWLLPQPLLHAVRLGKISEDVDFCPTITVPWPFETDRRRINIQYYKERVIDLPNDKTPSAISRAIRDGSTNISEQEVDDFLLQTRDCSFACFRLNNGTETNVYLIAIIPFSDFEFAQRKQPFNGQTVQTQTRANFVATATNQQPLGKDKPVQKETMSKNHDICETMPVAP